MSLSQPSPIRVGVYQNYPKIFVNQSGQAAGFWVDLMDEIAAAEDWTVEYIPCEWEVCLTNLEQGRLDLMPDVAHTPERDRRFNFNQELVLASWSVVYRHPRVPVHSLLDLDQKRVAVLKNSVQAEALLEQAEAFDIQPHIVTVDSFDTVFQHIQAGKVDAGITNRFFGTQAEQRYWVKKTNVFIEASHLHFATTPTSDHLAQLEKIDQHLRQWKHDPDSVYAVALRQWLEPDSGLNWHTVRQWLINWIIIIPIVGFVAAVIGNRRLQREIQQRQQVETALRHSEERFHVMMDNLPGVIFRYILYPDGSDRVIYMSTGCSTLWEVEAATVMESAAVLWEMVHPEDVDAMQAAVLQSAQTLDPWFWQWRIITPSGKLKWLEAAGRPTRQGDGSVLWDTLILDVSDRHQLDAQRQATEIALRASESRYRQVVQSQTDFILRSLPDTTITFANQALCQAIGTSLQEIIGHPWIDFANSSDLEKDETLQRLAQLTPDRATFMAVNRDQRADGQEGWTQWLNQGIFDQQGNLIEVQSVGRDITALKMTEQALQESEYLFRSVFEQVRVGIVFCDPTGVILRVNQKYCEITGYSAEELTQTIVFEMTAAGDRDQHRTLFDQMIAGEREMYSFEKQQRRKSGELIWVEVTSSILRNSEGERSLVVGIVDDISDRKAVEASLRESESKFRQLAETVQEVFWLSDTVTGESLYVSPAYATIWGRSCESFATAPRSFLESIHPEDQDWAIAHYRTHRDQPFELEYRIVRPDGAVRWICDRGFPIYDESGQLVRRAGVAQDITDRKQAELSLAESEARFRLVSENMSDLVCLHRPDGGYLYVTPSSQTMLGYAPDELIGRQPEDLIHPDDRDRFRNDLHAQTLHFSSNPSVYRIQTQTGAYIWIETLIKPLLNPDGEVQHLQTTSREVTDRVTIENQLRHDARHDALTGLPNRSCLMERLQAACQRAQADPTVQIAVLFLDLDQFKLINDSMGHLIGDQLLIAIAQHLSTLIRDTDLASRLGGDEFVILLEDITGETEAIQVAERVLAALRSPQTLSGREIFISTSIGIAISDKTYTEAEDLIRNADIALYRAKSGGRSRYALFDPAMHLQVINRLQLENDLRKALDHDQLVLYYQPIIALNSGEILGFEALIRWQHPTRGIIPPDTFIPIAEETGLIIPIGAWVLHAACAQLALWHHRRPSLKISVNLSPKQLQESILMQQITQVLAQTGIQGQHLTLEITESMVAQNIDATCELLTRIRSLGVQISIDDFGTGYSSLSYLYQLPIDFLKIDRAFVQHVRIGTKNQSIAESIVALSNVLELHAIAEGIETQEQLTWLQHLNCEMGQGYLFSQPIPVHQATALLS
jgi:diguanylate cyclase (GGDEF)-like protein/PAS domain S-box-containing protein